MRRPSHHPRICTLGLIFAAFLPGCATTHGQVAHGVSSQILRAFARDKCLTVDIYFRNKSTQPALLLSHYEYPAITTIIANSTVGLSFLEGTIHGMRLHRSPPEAIPIGPHKQIFMRVQLPLPLWILGPTGGENISLPLDLQASFGVVQAKDGEHLEKDMAILYQRITATDFMRISRGAASPDHCSGQTYFTHHDPAIGVTKAGVIRQIEHWSLFDPCRGEKKETPACRSTTNPLETVKPRADP